MTATLHRYRSRLGLIVLIFIAFIALGMPDGLLGIAWPSIRANFGLPLDALGMLLIASTSGYLTSSFSSGRLIGLFGVGKVLAASCALTGLALLGYTLAPAWWTFVALGVAVGLGAGAIDAGLNTYVAAHFGEGLMQWLHASYGVGVTLGPIIMTVGLTVFGAWRVGYTVVGVAQLVVAAAFVVTLPMWQRNDHRPAEASPQRLTDYRTPIGETLRRPAVWLSLLMFYLYVGAEASLGYWTYSLLTESRGMATDVAGFWAGSYWATFTIGRILAGLYTRRAGADTVVRGSLLAAVAGAALLWWNPVPVASLIGVALVGFAIAPIFPGLVSGTPSRVGPRYAANTIGMQISAGGLGAATIPGFAGVLARRTSLEAIPPFITIILALLLALYVLSMRPSAGRAAAEQLAS